MPPGQGAELDAVHLYALKNLQLEVTGLIYVDSSFFSQVLLSDLMEKDLKLSPPFSFLFAAFSLTARKIKDKEEREK